jgi:hypothetical protein
VGDIEEHFGAPVANERHAIRGPSASASPPSKIEGHPPEGDARRRDNGERSWSGGGGTGGANASNCRPGNVLVVCASSASTKAAA